LPNPSGNAVFKVLAAIRAGVISFSCEKCISADVIKDEKVVDNYIKKAQGCIEPLEKPARWIDEDEDWYNCPVRFICRSASDFLEEYNAYKKQIATPPVFGSHSAKFLEAVWVFEGMIAKFHEEQKGSPQ
jgi:hypothetical protein